MALLEMRLLGLMLRILPVAWCNRRLSYFNREDTIMANNKHRREFMIIGIAATMFTVVSIVGIISHMRQEVAKKEKQEAAVRAEQEQQREAETRAEEERKQKAAKRAKQEAIARAERDREITKRLAREREEREAIARAKEEWERSPEGIAEREREAARIRAEQAEWERWARSPEGIAARQQAERDARSAERLERARNYTAADMLKMNAAMQKLKADMREIDAKADLENRRFRAEMDRFNGKPGIMPTY